MTKRAGKPRKNLSVAKPAPRRREDPEALRRDIDAVQDAVVKLQDYLLRTSERMDHILGTLKNHRELLVKMNQRLFQVGTRERIRMELDIMKNTLSILALNGAELDEALLDEIRKVRESADKNDLDVVSLRRSKEDLDKKFQGEMKKLDPSALQRSRGKDEPDVPGYG